MLDRFLDFVAPNGIPNTTLANAFIRIYSFKNIPMMYYVRPQLVQLDEDHIEILIPLNRRNKNHIDSMFFGTLLTGADCACGVLAMSRIRATKYPINFLYKSVKADFLKRVEGDAHFYCMAGKNIVSAIDEAISTQKRVNIKIPVEVKVPTLSETEIVASFLMELSLKAKKNAS